jgi:signal transduction histidine kinase
MILNLHNNYGSSPLRAENSSTSGCRKTKDRTVGTGLGLSISYSIVKDHRGELTVESKPGEYTKIHMDLPVDNGLTS